MHRYRKEGDPLFVKDLWAPYKYVYHTPTEIELNMIKPFLLKFTFEDDEFIEDECRHWVEAKKDLDLPDLRDILMTFVKQVRESKGYDVDMAVGFFGSPFIPLRLDVKDVYDEGMAGTTTAINEINSLTLQSGKRYELVSLDKYVMTIAQTMLLSFTVWEVDSEAMEIDGGVDADGCLKIIQALVYRPQLTEFRLLEWKLKPDPPTCSLECPCVSLDNAHDAVDYLRWSERVANTTCK